MTPSGEVGCVSCEGRGDADAAVAVDVAFLPGATHPMLLSVCHVVGRALTLTSAAAVIRLSGTGANICAIPSNSIRRGHGVRVGADRPTPWQILT